MPHIHDKYDFTIGVVIVHNDRVLLVQHPRYDKWLTPGGHIELDEDPEQALYREIAEETGLQVHLLSDKLALKSPGTKFLPTPNRLDVHEANAPHKHINFLYYAVAESDKAVLSAEHLAMKWFDVSMLTDPVYSLSPAIIFYAQEALALAKRTS